MNEFLASTQPLLEVATLGDEDADLEAGVDDHRRQVQEDLQKGGYGWFKNFSPQLWVPATPCCSGGDAERTHCQG